MPAEAIFPQEYFVYYKGKWCTAGGKDPLFGHVDGFQIGPKMLNSELCILMDYQCEISRMLSRERISKGTVS